MLREGRAERKEGKIPMYQLRERWGARSSPTLAGTRQLQENTVCQLKGTASPSPICHLQRSISMAELGTPLCLLTAASPMLQTHPSSLHGLALMPQSCSPSQSRARHACGRAGALVAKVGWLLPQHPLTPLSSSSYPLSLWTWAWAPSVQLSPTALLDTGERLHWTLENWSRTLPSGRICHSDLSQCNFKAIWHKVDRLIKISYTAFGLNCKFWQGKS